ncbi:MAG: hypothetical protein WAS36_02910 [Candidatus Saccharimonadales bacterium]
MIISKLVQFFALAQVLVLALAITTYKIAVANSSEPEFAGFETWPLWLLFYLLGAVNLFLIPLYLYRVTSKHYKIERSWATIATIGVLAICLAGFYIVSKLVET